MKLFLFFINSIYWLWAFSVPVIVSGLPAWYLYEKAHKNLPYSILLLIAGIVSGIITAEAIRRKYGLVNFLAGFPQHLTWMKRKKPLKKQGLLNGSTFQIIITPEAGTGIAATLLQYINFKIAGKRNAAIHLLDCLYKIIFTGFVNIRGEFLGADIYQRWIIAKFKEPSQAL